MEAPTVDSEQVNYLRALAGKGRLAEVAASAMPELRVGLSGAVFSIAWPVVFNRLTRGIEKSRGHGACASSVFRMAESCLDRFYDDVEAVTDYVLAHAKTPIRNLEAWIATHAGAAAVDGHRRRRGQIGALQRPRIPMWLSTALDDDVWLVKLAEQILLWVGVRTTAGTELWPLDAWSLTRASVTGVDTTGSAVVAREVDVVLAAMRTHAAWYEDYVERPLGFKCPPVVSSTAELPALLLTDRADADDVRLAGLASTAIKAISARVRRGEEITSVVIDVIGTAFGAEMNSDNIDRPPFLAPDYERWVSTVLGDPGRVGGLVEAVLGIIAQPSASASG